MKKVILACFTGASLLMSYTLLDTGGLCDSPVVGGHTGAPGSPACHSCHSGTPNTGTGILNLSYSDSLDTYTPGDTELFSVSINQTSIDKFGFAITARKASDNSSIGTFIVLDPVNTRKFTDAGDFYFSHTPCGADATTIGSLTWQFKWKAPSSNVGNIKFYIAGLAANHNHATSGDYTYTDTLTVSPAASTDIKQFLLEKSFQIFPNPNKGRFSVQYDLNEPSTVGLKVINMAGKEVFTTKKRNQSQGLMQIEVNTALSKGVYQVILDINGSILQKKLVIND